MWVVVLQTSGKRAPARSFAVVTDTVQNQALAIKHCKRYLDKVLGKRLNYVHIAARYVEAGEAGIEIHSVVR